MEPPLTRIERMRQSLLSAKALGAMVLAGLAVVLVPSIPTTWSSVEQSERFRLTQDRLELPVPPDVVPRKIVAQTWERHPEWAKRNLLDRSLARDIAAGFAVHPWIALVDRVEKSRDGRVVVSVQYRVPVAVIETHRGLYPIDSQGVLLPSQDFSLTESSALPRIRGIRSIPNGQPGKPWGDPAVVAAARICEILMPNQNLETYWKRFHLEALIAPALTEESYAAGVEMLTFELVTEGGQRVVWGHSPGADALEPTPRQKLGRLEHYLTTYKTLDDPDVAWIDVTPIEGTLRRLRTAQSAPAGKSTQTERGRTR